MPHVDSAGVRLYYEEAGAGHPVVFVHEFCADLRFWEGQVRALSREYRCVAYNARGYPPSDVPVEVADYDWTRHVDDLRAVLDALEIERAHLVGLSMGAYTALQFALREPQRVSALAFCSGGAGSLPAGAARDPAEFIAAAERLLADGMPASARALALGPTRIQLREKDRRGWEQSIAWLAEHSAEGSSRTMRGFQARRPSLYDAHDALRAMTVPTLLVVGDEDDPIIELNVFLKRTIPRCGLWMVPRTGHAVNLEEPGAYNQALREFFGSVERGGWAARVGWSAPASTGATGMQAGGPPVAPRH